MAFYLDKQMLDFIYCANSDYIVLKYESQFTAQNSGLAIVFLIVEEPRVEEPWALMLTWQVFQ